MEIHVEKSQISEKGQTTIPISIRRYLHLEPGDSIVYEVSNNQISLKKAPDIDYEWAGSLETTLDEWAGTEDDDL